MAVVFTADNGYHIGNHRIPAGKSLFYAEDAHVPFVVKGPGIPRGVKSTIPSTHVDLAPTFLDIAGVPEEDWPELLDGNSLLKQWQQPDAGTGEGTGDGNSKESINIEHWGTSIIEAPNGRELGMPFTNTSYKTIRLVGDENASWLFTVWCSNEKELYNTAADPYEINNLAGSDDPHLLHVMDRLNAILLVTKSCEQQSCRQPWKLLSPPDGSAIPSFKAAMATKHDAFFAGLPRVQFAECMAYQYVPNEAPYYPAGAEKGLGLAHRGPTDNYAVYVAPPAGVADEGRYGSVEQRSATLKDIMAAARELTPEELMENANVTLTRKWLRLAELGHD